ncbi:hypothetical protein [Dictyobacter kobayashii]|nr:hypothetical protein [Dictyobacter kobayashii]
MNMVHWEHRYLLGTMVFSIAGNVVRDFDEEHRQRSRSSTKDEEAGAYDTFSQLAFGA